MRALMVTEMRPAIVVADATPDGWAECWIEVNGHTVLTLVLSPDQPSSLVEFIRLVHDEILKRC